MIIGKTFTFEAAHLVAWLYRKMLEVTSSKGRSRRLCKIGSLLVFLSPLPFTCWVYSKYSRGTPLYEDEKR